MRLRFDGFVLNLGTREILRGDRPMGVSPKAFELLELLVRQRPDAVSKEQIHRELWPGSFVDDGNLPNLVSELRRAIGDDAHRPRVIRTLHRFGYAFEAKEEGADETAGGQTAAAYRLIWGDREIALSDGQNVIGRDRDAVVWLDDVSVSRHHARIVIDRSGARIEDLESKNGTYVEGKRVSKPLALKDGNALRLGSVSLIFRRFEDGLSTETVSRR